MPMRPTKNPTIVIRHSKIVYNLKTIKTQDKVIYQNVKLKINQDELTATKMRSQHLESTERLKQTSNAV